MQKRQAQVKETMNNHIKQIPYGISDFKQVLSENKYLVDKTMFFERMERAGNFLFLVRPRRTTSTKRTTFRSCSRDSMWLSIRHSTIINIS